MANGNDPLKDKGDKSDVPSNYEDGYVETKDPLDISTAGPEDIAKANRALTIINGIYGYINEYDSSGLPTGNKIWLSLTPYEISPNLADISLFRPNDEDIKKQLSNFYIGKEKYEDILKSSQSKDSAGEKAKERISIINTNLSKAMTVGNRLQASRIVTNYLVEILNPRLDTRYGPKDHRIGQASRFLNSETGEESDRSAFLHIVPDLELSNGRIAIPFGIESRKKTDSITNQRKIESYRLAFVPVNFNFIHSNYTLTIKEFILSSVSEQNREIYSLDKTFDGNVLRFFGSHPKIISLSGVLSNFDDDLIGLEKLFGEITGETQTVSWLGTSGSGNQTAEISSRGSMRDVFLSYYNNFLKGTKAKDYGLKIYLYYNWRIIEGYIIDLNVQTSGENDNIMMFAANMVVKSESSVYEQGVGLGKSVPTNYYSRRFGAYGKMIKDAKGNSKDPFELDDIFSTEEMQYRRAFRDYAIQSTINSLKINQGITKNKGYPNDIYMQLLYPDDPYLSKLEEDTPIGVTETGRKLEQLIMTSDIKSLINLYLYRIIVSALKYNRKLDEYNKVKRESDDKAYLHDSLSNNGYPHPGQDAYNSWLSDLTEKTEGNYYKELWDAYKQQSLKTFVEAFLNEGGLSVDNHTFKLGGPTIKENGEVKEKKIDSSSSYFTDFLNSISEYIYENWILVSYNTLPGGSDAVATMTLSSLMGYVRDIRELVDKQ